MNSVADSPNPMEMPHVPWWRRVTRWRQQSASEARSAELALMASRTPLTAIEMSDITISKGVTMHHVHIALGDDETGKKMPLVLLPGYASGAAIWWVLDLLFETIFMTHNPRSLFLYKGGVTRFCWGKNSLSMPWTGSGRA